MESGSGRRRDLVWEGQHIPQIPGSPHPQTATRGTKDRAKASINIASTPYSLYEPYLSVHRPAVHTTWSHPSAVMRQVLLVVLVPTRSSLSGGCSFPNEPVFNPCRFFGSAQALAVAVPGTTSNASSAAPIAATPGVAIAVGYSKSVHFHLLENSNHCILSSGGLSHGHH